MPLENPSPFSSAALDESEERNRRLLEGIKDHSVFVTSLNNTIVDWTPGAEAIFG